MSGPGNAQKTSFLNRKTILAAFVCAFIAFTVYLPSIYNGFVNWDDPDYVYENPIIRSMDLFFLKSVFTDVFFGNWHPLTMISYGLDYSAWGLNPLGYHLTNIVFHALNTFLVFILAVRLFELATDDGGYASGRRKLAAGLTTALLFGLHPLHVESVAWISERKDVLSGFFFLLSLLAYLKHIKAGKKAFYYSSALFFFILALMSKPMAVSLPLVLLIIDFYPLRLLKSKGGTGAVRAVLEKIPFFMLSAFSAYMAVWAQKSGEALVPVKSLPLLLRADTAVRAYAFYLKKMIAPVGLAPLYPLPFRTEFFNSVFFISLSALLTITVFCLITARKRGVFLSVWLYYIITLLPVIGIVQVGEQAAADRYTYLPSIGPFLLAGIGTGLICERLGKIHLKAACAAVAAIILIALASLSIRQMGVWKDSLSLWSYEIEVYPGRVPSAYSGRGLSYQELGDYKHALEDFTAAISIAPRYADAYNNRGVVYRITGDYRQAIEDFSAAISINPRLATAYNNLGSAYMDTGDTESAFKAIKKAQELGFK